MDNIYFNCVLNKKIIVESKYLNENINNYIENYLKNNTEGICIDEGYIKPESTKIIKKSIGMLLCSNFTGDITYEVLYTASVCNPVIGNIIECKIKFVNKLGLLGTAGPLSIIIGKQFHISDNKLNKIKEGDIVKIEVIAKKFSLNDKEIKIIAKLWDENNIKDTIISSDLTPIMSDENEYNNNIDENNYSYDNDNDSNNDIEEDFDEYNEDNEDIEDDEDDIDEENEDNNIKIKNPDEDIEDDDIDLISDSNYESETEDLESIIDYE